MPVYADIHRAILSAFTVLSHEMETLTTWNIQETYAAFGAFFYMTHEQPDLVLNPLTYEKMTFEEIIEHIRANIPTPPSLMKWNEMTSPVTGEDLLPEGVRESLLREKYARKRGCQPDDIHKVEFLEPSSQFLTRYQVTWNDGSEHTSTKPTLAFIYATIHDWANLLEPTKFKMTQPPVQFEGLNPFEQKDQAAAYITEAHTKMGQMLNHWCDMALSLSQVDFTGKGSLSHQFRKIRRGLQAQLEGTYPHPATSEPESQSPANPDMS